MILDPRGSHETDPFEDEGASKMTEQETLIDIILEQQETILLLVESIKTGGIVNEKNIAEMLERSYRIRDKALKMKAKAEQAR